MNKNMNSGKDEKDHVVFLTPDDIVEKNVFPKNPFFRGKKAHDWFKAAKFNDFKLF
jgi:hypothetical protein